MSLSTIPFLFNSSNRYAYRVTAGQSTGYVESSIVVINATTIDVCNVTCVNGGTPNPATCVCDCIGSWVGDECNGIVIYLSIYLSIPQHK